MDRARPDYGPNRPDGASGADNAPLGRLPVSGRPGAKALISARAALLALLLLALAASPPATPPPATPTPWGAIEHVEGAAPRQVLVKGKPFAYFRMSRRFPIRFTVRGPAQLIVISRAELPPGSAGPSSYYVRVLAAHSVLKVQKPESGPAPDVRLADSSDVTLCESRRLVVPIQEGEQTIWIQVGGAPSVFIRVLFEPPEGESWARESLQPAKSYRTLTVTNGGEQIPYYTAAHGKPVTFRIEGPARLELTSRLDCEADARHATPYTLLVTSGCDSLRTLRYRAIPAKDAAYMEIKDRVPSQPERAVLTFGPGPAEVTVALADPRDGAAEIRARLLKPSEEGED